jgi:hypothetical protein
MSASASVYTLTPLSFVNEWWRQAHRACGCGIGSPNRPPLGEPIGLAEAQRLEQGPVMGINWIGSVGLPVVYTKLLLVDLAGGQQETRFIVT